MYRFHSLCSVLEEGVSDSRTGFASNTWWYLRFPKHKIWKQTKVPFPLRNCLRITRFGDNKRVRKGKYVRHGGEQTGITDHWLHFPLLVTLFKSNHPTTGISERSETPKWSKPLFTQTTPPQIYPSHLSILQAVYTGVYNRTVDT